MQENNWIYRKWNNGKAECWGRLTPVIAYSTQRFNAHAYMGEYSGSFPLTLGTNPIVIANGAGYAGTYGALIQSFSNDGITYTVRLIREGPYTNPTQPSVINIYALGTWQD